jgi:hypothetical protein
LSIVEKKVFPEAGLDEVPLVLLKISDCKLIPAPKAALKIYHNIGNSAEFPFFDVCDVIRRFLARSRP